MTMLLNGADAEYVESDGSSVAMPRASGAAGVYGVVMVIVPTGISTVTVCSSTAPTSV